jgi:inorganic pyrophosphatase
MVVMEEPSFPGCLILARPIGLLELLDAGIYDGKLLCVPAHDPHLEGMVSINQLSLSRLEEISEFFRTNRGLDGRTTEILGWREGEAATALVEHCVNSAAAQAPPRNPGPEKFAPDH